MKTLIIEAIKVLLSLETWVLAYPVRKVSEKKGRKTMSGYNFNHFTGKTRGKASRKKKIRMKQNHKDKYEKYSNNRGIVR